jgi:hypothetical protein
VVVVDDDDNDGGATALMVPCSRCKVSFSVQWA